MITSQDGFWMPQRDLVTNSSATAVFEGPVPHNNIQLVGWEYDRWRGCYQVQSRALPVLLLLYAKDEAQGKKRGSLTKVDIETAIVFPRVTDIPDNAAEILQVVNL